MGITYFAADGSFGNAVDLVIIDTTNWDADDWDHVEMAPDRDRARVARELSENNPDQLQLPLEN